MSGPENPSAEDILNDLDRRATSLDVTNDGAENEVAAAAEQMDQLQQKIQNEGPEKRQELMNRFNDVRAKMRIQIQRAREVAEGNDALQAATEALDREIGETERAADVPQDTPAEPGERPADAERRDPASANVRAQPEAFIQKLSAAKGGEKLAVIMEKIGEMTDQIMDFLSNMGSGALMNLAGMLERFNVLDKPWIDQLRAIAGSEKAVLQEKFKSRNLVLTKDISVNGRENDKNALGRLRQLYDTERAKRTPATAPASPAPAPAAAPAAPGTAPQPAPAAPVYSFEQYVSDIVMPAVSAKTWETNLADEQGRRKLTLTDILSVLPA